MDFATADFSRLRTIYKSETGETIGFEKVDGQAAQRVD
jgi:hypothetical protein